MRKNILVISAIAVLFGLSMSIASATKGNEDNVTICHRTNSVTNPYVQETVDPSAVDGEGNNDHTHHTGPVATSQTVAQALKDDKTKWGDIIPPYGDFEGLNWTSEGQAMFNNNCNYVVPGNDDDEKPKPPTPTPPNPTTTPAPTSTSQPSLTEPLPTQAQLETRK